MNSFVVCCLAVATLLPQDAVVATSDETQSLREELFENRHYDSSRHPNNQVVMIYDITYTDCPTIDTSTGRLTSPLREKQQWTDDRLTWSRSESRLKKLDLLADEVWTPGVAIAASTGEELSTELDTVILKRDGSLIRRRYFQLSTNCDQTGNAWKCQLRFMFWKNTGPHFEVEEGNPHTGIRHCRDEDLKIEEYTTQITEEGGVGNLYYYYTIDIVIQAQ